LEPFLHYFFTLQTWSSKLIFQTSIYLTKVLTQTNFAFWPKFHSTLYPHVFTSPFSMSRPIFSYCLDLFHLVWCSSGWWKRNVNLLAIPTLIQILVLPNSMVKLLMGSTTKWQTCYDEHNGLNQGRDWNGYGVSSSMFCYSKAQGKRGVIDNNFFFFNFPMKLGWWTSLLRFKQILACWQHYFKEIFYFIQ
jgi:hypothetical protein